MCPQTGVTCCHALQSRASGFESCRDTGFCLFFSLPLRNVYLSRTIEEVLHYWSSILNIFSLVTWKVIFGNILGYFRTQMGILGDFLSYMSHLSRLKTALGASRESFWMSFWSHCHCRSAVEATMKSEFKTERPNFLFRQKFKSFFKCLNTQLVKIPTRPLFCLF